MQTAGELLRAYYRALDVPALDDLSELLAPECDWRFPGAQLQGAEAVRNRMARTLALGLSMEHQIGHLLDHGDVAICELIATNRLPEATYSVAGAVVCEAADGRISRLVAYPDAEQMTAFLEGLRVRATAARDRAS
ncbi:MAG: nuclear transport factor 2 family protein [Dehalococcoidia bacterium]